MSGGKKGRIALVVCRSITVAWAAIVIWLSCQNGEQTVELNLGIVERLTRLMPQLMQRYSMGEIHFWVRKAGHVLAFFVLGIAAQSLALIRSRWTGVHPVKISLIMAGACMVLAVGTELVKVYIPGRHLNWSEAVLNMVCAGCGNVLLMLRRRRR